MAQRNCKKENIFLCSKKTLMIQRIQTVYLVLAVVVTAVLPMLFPLWETAEGKEFYMGADLLYVAFFGLSTTLSVVSIISYKKRQHQFVMGRLNIILNIILLGLLIYRSLNLSGETAVSEKGIGMFLPIVAIVLLALANKAIKKDEDLVKSVDRLR